MTKPHSSCAIVIVTHNSELHLAKNLRCLLAQTRRADQIIIVDSGSQNPDYLSAFKNEPTIHLVMAGQDIGFCQGNNIGMQQVHSSSDYVLFLNPDAFLTPTFLQTAIETMEDPSHAQVAALTSPLYGYDIVKDLPTGLYDSTGVFRTWYGRFYDRDQGKLCNTVTRNRSEFIPAICGALMLCRVAALQQVVWANGDVFDPSFFMYKEDVDLSLRLRDRGWKLLLEPRLTAYHCRGWNRDRKKIPRRFRLMSVKNELTLNIRRKSPYALYSSLKYLAVRILNA